MDGGISPPNDGCGQVSSTLTRWFHVEPRGRCSSRLFRGSSLWILILRVQCSPKFRGMPESNSSTLSRRDQRKQSRTNNRRATDHSGDERMTSTSLSGNMNRVPRSPLQRVISLMQFLESYDQDVTKIESALGDLKAKDAEIRKLDSTNRVLINSKDEKIEALEREINTLVADRNEIDRREEVLRQNEEELATAKARADLEKEQLKQRLSRDSERKIADGISDYMKQTGGRILKLDNDNKELIREKERLASDLAASQEELNREKEESHVTFRRISKENQELERALKELQGRYPVYEEPLGSYKEKLEMVYQTVKAITQQYMGQLPQELDDVEAAQRYLSEKHNIFKSVPLSMTPLSTFLRVRSAECIIFKRICACLWQPFYSQNSEKQTGETSLSLGQVSHSLAAKDRNKESIWRCLTWEGLDGAAKKNGKDLNAVQPLVNDIAPILLKLVPKERHGEFRQDLGGVLQGAVEFWNRLKRDSCMVEFDMNPPAVIRNVHEEAGWISEHYLEMEPSMQGQQPPVVSDRNAITKGGVNHTSSPSDPTARSWCLFPKVALKSLSGETVTVPGHVLLTDSLAFREAAEELKAQQEAMEQALNEAKEKVKERRRRPTLRKDSLV